jgi:GMP synthase (glutamine-hydrolysing)
MRVLVFRHVPFEGLGLIGPVLEQRGISVEYADLYLPGARPRATEGFDGVIFMGGPMSVNDDLPYLQWELQAITGAIERGRPLLGICLGSQLLAKALGARVYRNREKEIGWFDLEFAESAQSDPLFRGLPARETVFHWHGESFDLPPGATLLASSARCRNQAFRVGDRTYGLQFHLEVTPAMIADWCEQDDNCGDVRELPEPLDPAHNAARLSVLADTVFSRWCDILAESSPFAAARLW